MARANVSIPAATFRGVVRRIVAGKPPANPIGLTGGTRYGLKCHSWHHTYLKHFGCQIRNPPQKPGFGISSYRAKCARWARPFSERRRGQKFLSATRRKARTEVSSGVRR
jgi:hypothetical protein